MLPKQRMVLCIPEPNVNAFSIMCRSGLLMPVLLLISVENQQLTLLSFPIWWAMNMIPRDVKEFVQGRNQKMNSVQCLFSLAIKITTKKNSVGISGYLLHFQINCPFMECCYIAMYHGMLAFPFTHGYDFVE